MSALPRVEERCLTLVGEFDYWIAVRVIRHGLKYEDLPHLNDAFRDFFALTPTTPVPSVEERCRGIFEVIFEEFEHWLATRTLHHHLLSYADYSKLSAVFYGYFVGTRTARPAPVPELSL